MKFSELIDKLTSIFKKKSSPEGAGTINKQDEKPEEPVRQTGLLKERLARVKKTRWIRFGIVSVIFFAWVAWLENWWVALWWFLLADIYLTQFIPWNWWKFSKNKTLRMVMSWVDAIVYALVLVYFLFAFVGQNYQIPSSSLEKTLLTGDFLWVNKMVYGPRVPMTPLHFPLAQNEIFGVKSYIQHPQFKYHRLKGLRNVERGDIVVFNFPAGDTVVVGMPNPDYYTQVLMSGVNELKPNRSDFTNDPTTYDRVMAAGRKIVRGSNKVIYHPVDRRDNYVKRCVGLPGEYLKVVDGVVYINGSPITEPKNVQYNYYVPCKGGYVDADYMVEELGMAREDIKFKEDSRELLEVPLTHDMKTKLEKCPWVAGSITRVGYDDADESIQTYPIGVDYGWTRGNYGWTEDGKGIWIPKKDYSIELNKYNYELYGRCIRDYECVDLTFKNGQAYIDGKPAKTYKFKMDYYWMMGDNRDNSLDSRFWGFVPEDHIVGTPMFVIVSFDKEKGWFDGKIRWNRIFRDANPDK